MNTPLVLLDFDGVVNAKSTLRLPGDTTPVSQWADLEARKLPTSFGSVQVNISPTVVEALNTLSSEAETRWMTSWFEDTKSFTELGFKDFPFESSFEFFNECEDENTWWKLEFLKTHHLNRDVVWVEDEVRSDVHSWVEQQNGRVTFIQTNPRTGITAENLNEILLALR